MQKNPFKGEKMEKQNTKKIAIAILTILLVSSALAVISNSTVTTSGLAVDYGDVMQYDWPYGAYNESRVLSYDGPAPNNPELLWTLDLGMSWSTSAVTTFNGKAFVCTSNSLYALDPFTGEVEWQTPITGARGFVPVGAWKLDDTYLCIDTGSMFGQTGGLACYEIEDGDPVWEVDMGILGHAGGELKNYWPMIQSTELKMKYVLNYDPDTLLNTVVGWDLSATPAEPAIEWEYVVDEPCEILCFGDGKLFVGTYTYHIFALNGTTGDLIWKARKVGLGAYSAIYANGKLYHGDASTRLTCYNANTGDILWDTVQTGREFFSYGEAYAYGRIYAKNIGVPEGFIGCWDAESGELLWKTAPAYYNLGYLWPCVGDGKMFTIRSDGSTTTGRDPMPGHFACLDAWTGEVLWTLPYQFTSPTLGYGMLFGASFNMATFSTTLYCFGDAKKSWSYFRGDPYNQGVGKSGPIDISSPRWIYETGDAVQSSAAIADGKVYVGSNDQNLYCLDAYTGEKIWNFTTEYKLRSSAAVADGKVFTGADDGNIYCLDAQTGTETWRKDIYSGNVPPITIEVSSFQPRSSPIIIDDRLYVGALDGNVYCLDTSDGSEEWKFETGGPIFGSPAYSNGVIYIASTNRNMYALDASTGNEIWHWTTPKSTTQLHFAPTPVVAEGKVFFGGGAAYDTPIIFVALNATDGTSAWQIDMDPDSNTQPIQSPTYYNGVLYTSEHMGASAFSAADGSRIWYQWLGFQVFGSVALAEDRKGDANGESIGAKVYVGCDSYSVTCLRADNGTTLSSYTTEAQVASSPALWDGKLYVGSADGKVYCFDDSPRVSTTIYADSNKGEEMWNNETLTIQGKLAAAINRTNLEAETTDFYYPSLPNSEVILSITKPDMSSENVTTTTDEQGAFTVSYNPETVGNWGWVIFYEGEQLPYIIFNAAYGEWNSLEVVSPPTPQEPQEPPPQGMPIEYVYVAVAIIVIVIVAIGAYVFIRRTKK